jgi:hypothetical protein
VTAAHGRDVGGGGGHARWCLGSGWVVVCSCDGEQ